MKRIFGYVTNRTTDFTEIGIKFIKKWVNDIDEFHLFTTKEAYEIFFSKVIDFKHTVTFFDNDWFFPNRMSWAFYKFALELANIYDDDTILNINGDGGFFIKNPFEWVKNHENNFDDYDIINTIYKDHCFDTAAFFKNNDRSRNFLKQFTEICENPPKDLLIYDNQFKERKKLWKLHEQQRWFITQDLFWNIYLKNPTVNFLSNLANVKFFTKKFHWAGNSSSPEKFVSSLYDSLFLEEECLINLLGKFKNSLPRELFTYYFDIIDNKDEIISKEEFINKYSKIDENKHKNALNHYRILFTK